MTTVDSAVRPAATTLPPIPFARLLRVEWRKSLDTRAARWLLASVGLMATVAAVVPVAFPSEVDQTLPSYLATVSLGVTLLLPVVSILMLTAEWTRRTVLSTFTQEPRRGHVLAAKLCCGLGLALVGALIGLALAAGGLALSGTLGRDTSWDIGPGPLVGFLLFVVLNSVIGMAFGTLLHNTAVAIVAFLGLPSAIALLAVALKSVRDWIDPATTLAWVLDNSWAGHVAQILTSLAIWVALPLAVGLPFTLRREVQ